MQKITPCLWFNNNGEEAINFYASIFNDCKITNKKYYGEAGPGPKGSLLAATFQMEGQEFMVLNGGPIFQFSPAISFFVKCSTQEEVDNFWNKLSAEGQEQQCGWVTDKFGVSWQIVPSILGELLDDPDEIKSQKVMYAMLQMKKIIISDLKAAYEK